MKTVARPKSCTVKEFAAIMNMGLSKAYEIANAKNSGFCKVGRTWRISERELLRRYGVSLTDEEQQARLPMSDAEFQEKVNRCIYNFLREIMTSGAEVCGRNDGGGRECKHIPLEK